MYQAQKALFFYCISPVHMGAGTAIGLIDNPIQRERHTEYPIFAGSGLKGAVRHHFRSDGWNNKLLDRIFGPEGAEYAGALSFGDAQLVAFPVRCTKRAYVYATSPTALARAKRQLDHLGYKVRWSIPEVEENRCAVVPDSPTTQEDKLNLEVFQYDALKKPSLANIANWLASNALPQEDAYSFFRDKINTDLVLLPDEDFVHYVKNATVVEPHIRIDDKTGAAKSGGLFYTENLPPESLLLAPLMASAERNDQANASAQDVLATVLEGRRPGDKFEDDEDAPDGDRKMAQLDGLTLQVGGDATTGRGQVVVKACNWEKD